VRFSYVLFACLLSVLPLVAQAAGPAAEQCFNLSSHAEARACLESLEVESAALLGRTEQAFRMALYSWDQETPFKTRARATLATSVEMFSQYRAAQCALQASLAAGGNAASDRLLLCAIQLNGQRVAQLQNEMAALK
jgi:hypothetical protein